MRSLTPLTRASFLVALLLGLILLAGCEAKITRENFDKIETGMSQSKVEKLLGGKGLDETPSGTSITGAGVIDSKKAASTIFRWKDGAKYIVVTFRDGKVFEKQQDGL